MAVEEDVRADVTVTNPPVGGAFSELADVAGTVTVEAGVEVIGVTPGEDLKLDYALLDSFVSASERPHIDPRGPWIFEALTEALNYKAVDVARILSDGGLLMERSRANLMSESWFNTWAAETGASVVTDDAPSPDFNSSGESAATVTFSADAVSKLRRITEIAADAGTDNTDAIVSCWLRSTSGTEKARIGLRDKTGAEPAGFLLSPDLTLTTTFTRFSFYVADIGAGAIKPHGLLVNATDAAARTIEAWGFQVEHLVEAISSPIRTDGATETRADEDARFAAGNWNFLKTGDFKVDLWPLWNTTDKPAGGTEHAVFGGNLTADRLTFRFTGTVWQCNYFEFGPPVRGSLLAALVAGAAFSAGDKVTVFVMRSLDKIQMSVNDGPVIEGSVSATPLIGWATSTGQCFVGLGNNLIRHFDGVLAQPVRI